MAGMAPSRYSRPASSIGGAHFADPAADAHLVWATMHGLVTIELMHNRWRGPSPHTCGAIRSSTRLAAPCAQRPLAKPGHVETGANDLLRWTSASFRQQSKDPLLDNVSEHAWGGVRARDLTDDETDPWWVSLLRTCRCRGPGAASVASGRPVRAVVT